LYLASFYVAEGDAVGINSDVAFIHMCLETGFLRFGNLVTPDMHNYCGLGANIILQVEDLFRLSTKL